MILDPNIYKKIFFDTMGELPDVISSVDHVFSSFPLRIVDSHYKLSKYDKVMVLLWDLTIPNIKKYRSELCIDSGIFSSREKKYQLFQENTYYFNSNVFTPDFNSIKQNSLKVLNDYLLIRNSKLLETFLKRISELETLYLNNIDIKSAPRFYIKNLTEIYKYLGLNEQYNLIKESMMSVFESNMISQFIPRIFENTYREEYGFMNLLLKTDLFKPPYFRKLSLDSEEKINFSQKEDIISNFSQILSLLELKKIAPSNQVFFWAWSLVGLKHFGNDFNFINEIEKVLDNIGISNNISALQITEPKKDGVGFIEFDNVLSYSPVLSGQPKCKFMLSKTKVSRVSNFVDIYVHIGKDSFIKYWKDFLVDGSVKKIKMGEIL